ncbi:hypothetical protein AMAG_07661 [Allomyces macrogynus ATCC 38327]|uniref:AAA+ ATPase domain-containing protein n=1 Tax=Allomyces macrogynus (strain ATCC 38327) TaxID=578462 RepID=A0A0L0SIW2_ALLM3|nr:hypothetical protein AMAG_07661 [Allomyces macrogynus ATCC 38327]|eukprot:KNE62443.1 hypothetical protein AMAG_07661 [Allomyces macrogynus ATCC 38327]
MSQWSPGGPLLPGMRSLSAVFQAIEPQPVTKVRVTIAALLDDKMVFWDLDQDTRNMLVAQELQDLVVAPGHFVKTSGFIAQIIAFAELVTHGQIVPWTEVQLVSSSTSPSIPIPSSTTVPAPSPPAVTPPAGLESVFTQLYDMTYDVSRVAMACGAHLEIAAGPDVLSPYPGESERQLRERFAADTSVADTGRPVVVFLDEVDALAPNRADAASSVMHRVVAQLLTLMDGMRRGTARVVVVAATNRPNAINSALRRPGRFDCEVVVAPPGTEVRGKVLKSLLGKVPVADDVGAWLPALAECTPGYIGADLAALVREACREIVGTDAGVVRVQDLLAALKRVPPSLRRGHAVALDRVLTWDDIGGLDDVKQIITQTVLWPLERRAQLSRLGLTAPRGLLYGPPPGDIFGSHVGEAEATIRGAFHHARLAAPSLLFLDEIDTLVGSSGLTGGGGESDPARERVLTTLLNEMDAIEGGGEGETLGKSVVVVAATKHPDRLDPALVRSGRLDRAVYVRAPDARERKGIFDVYLRKMPAAVTEAELSALAEEIPGATGADIENMCREAALACLRRGDPAVSAAHLREAWARWVPTMTREMVAYYETLTSQFK